MKVTVLKNKQVKFEFEVNPDEFEHGIDHAYTKKQKEVEVKGFRKGHVPRNIYENKFGVETLYEDALNHVLSHKYQDILKDRKYEIVSDPIIDVDFKKVTKDKPFKVSLTFDVKPEVELGEYLNLEEKYDSTEVKESDVELELLNMRKNSGTFEPKNGELLVGDTAIFDFEGFLNDKPFDGGKAENHELEIGSNQFIPGFEEQMVGMKKGEKKDINVTFPKNYHSENLKGKDVVFKIKLHDIKTKVPSELNDKWVKSLKRDEKTVSSLKKAIEKDLQSRKKTNAENKFNSTIISKVLEASKLEIPKSMIEREAKGQIEQVKQQAKQYNMPYEQLLQFQGMTPEMFEKNARRDAEIRVKMNLVLEAVAVKEKLKVTKKDLDEAYKNLVETHKVTLEYVKNVIPEEQMKKDILPQLGYKFILKNAKKI